MRYRLVVWLMAAAGAFLAAWPVGAETREVKKITLEVSGDFDYDSNTTQQQDLPSNVKTTGKRGSMVYILLAHSFISPEK